MLPAELLHITLQISASALEWNLPLSDVVCLAIVPHGLGSTDFIGTTRTSWKNRLGHLSNRRSVNFSQAGGEALYPLPSWQRGEVYKHPSRVELRPYYRRDTLPCGVIPYGTQKCTLSGMGNGGEIARHAAHTASYLEMPGYRTNPTGVLNISKTEEWEELEDP